MYGGGKDSSKNLHQVRVNKGLEKKQKLRATTHKIKKRLVVRFGNAKVRTFQVEKTPKEFENIGATIVSNKTLPRKKNVPKLSNNNTRKNFLKKINKEIEKLYDYRKRIEKLTRHITREKMKLKILQTLRNTPKRQERKIRLTRWYNKDTSERRELENKVSKLLEESS